MGNEFQERAIVENNKLRVCFRDTWLDVPLNDYEDIQAVGAGANAVVVSGINKTTKRLDAIKIYTPNIKSKDGEVSIDQFLKEVRKLASINDNRIATVYAAFDITDSIHVVTMEYINGITLKEWVSEKRSFDEGQDTIDRVLMAKNILEAVLVYQEQGIIHGDIHSNNIMIDYPNRSEEFDKGSAENIHIIDFGTSLFSKEGQSEQRESFLVYDLVRLLLGKQLDGRIFTFCTPKKIYDKEIQNDVREKIPILVTKTLLSYINALDLLLQLSPSELNPSDIVELCVELSKGLYIDFDYAIKWVYNRIEKRVDINSVAQILFDNICANTIPDSVDKAYVKKWNLYEDMLESYYKMMLETRNRWNIEGVKKEVLRRNYFTEEKYYAYIDSLQHCQVKSSEL